MTNSSHLGELHRAFVFWPHFQAASPWRSIQSIRKQLHCHPCCATICSQLVQSLHCVPGRASSQTPPVCLPLITQTQVSCHVVPMSGWVLCPCSLSNCCSHLPLRLWPFLHDIDIVHILAIVGPQKIHTMTLMTISMVANSSEGLRDKAIMKQIHTLPS